MEFSNSFVMPVGIEEAFAILTDLERVAPCMPGARLEDAQDGVYTGRVKIKVGPMSLSYRGTAELVEKDAHAHTARIVAKGNETRGGGTASADVHATLAAAGDDTKVTVTTQINITGRPAQFGRGVLADVGESIIDQFAENLSVQLNPPPATETSDSQEPAARHLSTTDGAPTESDALDLTAIAGLAARQKAIPILATIVLLLFLVRRFRRA